MPYKPFRVNSLYLPTLYEFLKVAKALYREGLFLDFLKYTNNLLTLMSLSNRLINLARQLTEEQMKSLQLSLSYVNSKDREYRLQQIEDILTDYGLPVEGLTKKQIVGFANFVNNL